MGVSHASSGIVAGLAATVPLASVMPLGAPEVTAAATLTAGAAMLPDLDHPGATASHTFGPLTVWLGKMIGAVARGHRKGTHSLLGVAAFTAVGFLLDVVAPQWALFPLLWLILAVGADPFVRRKHHVLLLVFTGLLAGSWAWITHLPFGLVPVTIGVGTVTHILGDAITKTGVPWLFPFTDRNYRLARIHTGKWVEKWIIRPLLAVGFAVSFVAAYL